MEYTTEARSRFRDELAGDDWLYFDHASTGFYPARTVRAIQEYAATAGDPIGYQSAENAELRQSARAQVAQITGSTAELVTFTSSLAEAMNLFANGIDWREGDNVVIPAGEFPSVTYTFVNIRKRYGVEVRRAPAGPAGRTDVERIIEQIDGRTRAVAISHVEWADGYRNDIAALGAACRERGVELFVDATQSMGAQPVDLPAWGASAVASHAYKWLLAGHGLGVVAFAEDAIERIYPTYAGFHSFEIAMDDASYSYDDTTSDFAFKPGAERYQTGGFDKLSMTALNASLSLILEADPKQSSEHGSRLVERIAEGAEARGYRVASDLSPSHRSQYLAITTGSAEGDQAVVEQLAGQRIKVVLRPKGIRVAPYFYHDDADVERFIEVLPSARIGP